MEGISRDDIADMALNAVDELIVLGYVPDCTDTYDESELEIQDVIREKIEQKLKILGFKITI